MWSFVINVLLVFLALSSTSKGAAETENDLRHDIFKNYNKNVRPVKKASSTVTVTIKITPLSLRLMDEKDQLIYIDAWIMMKWKDEYLQWDPSVYDNISMLHLSPLDIWRPDISLYTASPASTMSPEVQTQAVAYHDGRVVWVPPFTIKSRCPLPIRNITNKEGLVECNIRFGSWTYSSSMMDIQLDKDEVDLTNFEDFNSEWKLVKILWNQQLKFYPDVPGAYPMVNFNVTLKKRNYAN